MKYFIALFLLVFLLGKSSAQNQWHISVSSGAISPKFLFDSPLGYQIEGRIFYVLSDSIQLSISSGFHSWQEKLGYNVTKFKTIPLFVGIKYSFPFRFYTPYLAGELGVHFINSDYTLHTYEISERSEGLFRLVSSELKSESVTKFAFRLSIGSAFIISKHLDIDLGIRYNRIHYDFIYISQPDTLWSTQRINFYSIILGLNYKF